MSVLQQGQRRCNLQSLCMLFKRVDDDVIKRREGLHQGVKNPGSGTCKILWIRSDEVISKTVKHSISFEPKVRQAENNWQRGMRVQTTVEDRKALVESKTVNFCCDNTETCNPTRPPRLRYPTKGPEQLRNGRVFASCGEG